MDVHHMEPRPRGRNRLTRAAVVLTGALALGACGNSVEAQSVPTSVQAKTSIPEQSPNITVSPEKKENRTHSVTATVYWIGEGATADSGYIANIQSAWSDHADTDFGGVDTPEGRTFTPRHNTYYVALPASEFDENGPRKGAYEAAPWDASQLNEGESLFKGRWVMIEKDGKTAYAQWQDVGPCSDGQPECATDYEYVFGDKKQPVNQFGQKAGIDVSPDIARSLGIDGSSAVKWRFVDDNSVPDGPWKKYPAITNKTNWK